MAAGAVGDAAATEAEAAFAFDLAAAVVDDFAGDLAGEGATDDANDDDGADETATAADGCTVTLEKRRLDDTDDAEAIVTSATATAPLSGTCATAATDVGDALTDALVAALFPEPLPLPLPLPLLPLPLLPLPRWW